MFWDCGGFRDIRWVVNWSALLVEAFFETSFGFSYVLFGAVIALYYVNDVFGVTVNVISDRSGFGCSVECVWSLSVRYVFTSETVFPYGYEPRGWLCYVRLQSLALTRKALRQAGCYYVCKLQSISSIIRKHFHILISSPRCYNVFNTFVVVSGSKQYMKNIYSKDLNFNSDRLKVHDSRYEKRASPI